MSSRKTGTATKTTNTTIAAAGLSASKDHEALWPPVLKARRRRKRQHLHRCMIKLRISPLRRSQG